MCCSDGRYHAHFEEYVRSHVGLRPDMIALPGGPVGLVGWSSSFDHERVLDHALRLLTGSHAIHAAWLIAHQGCGFYRDKHGNLPEEQLAALQRRDLLLARRRLLERHPGLAVHCVFARVHGERVLFEDLRAAPG